MASKFYGLFFTSLASKEINLLTDNIKVMLVGSGYTPDQDTHRYKSQVTNEVTGTGYTAGGVTIGSMAFTYDTSTNRWSFDAVDATWSSSTISARYAVLYDSTPATDATRPLIGYVDPGGVISSTAATFSVVFDPSGIGAITVS